MFSIDIDRGTIDSYIDGVIADVFVSPAKALQAGIDAKRFFDACRKAALKMTAARLRKRMREAFEENKLGWDKHAEHSNWFGTGQSTPIGALIKANKPLATHTKKGRKAVGYSRKAYIKPPTGSLFRKIGGRYATMMRYELTGDGIIVGLLRNMAGTKWTERFTLFQEGGITRHFYGSPDQTSRYFAALGMPLRRFHQFKMPRRPLISKIEKLYPPDRLFEEAFEQKLLGENSKW